MPTPRPRPPRDPLLAALLLLPRVRARRMLGGVACFAGPRLFAVSRVDTLVLRLPAAERDALLARGVARPFEVEPETPSAEWLELPRPIPMPRHEVLRMIEAAWAHARIRRRAPAMRRRRRAAREA